MHVYALRLVPGDDLKQALVVFTRKQDIKAGFILTCVGSLSSICLRMAGAADTITREEDYEIIALVGTLSPDGAHLHLSVSDRAGQMLGGHLKDGSIVRTTAEIVIGATDDYTFAREFDARTGYDELTITPTED